jgi:hypothetical protein
MTKLVVVDRSGAEHQIEGSDGLMVMELLRDINFWRSAADVVPARLATSISIRRSKQRCRRSIPMKTIAGQLRLPDLDLPALVPVAIQRCARWIESDNRARRLIRMPTRSKEYLAGEKSFERILPYSAHPARRASATA